MEITITKGILEELFEKAKVMDEKREYASELIKTAQDQGGGNPITLKRDGKDIEVTESILWQEVFMLGVDCDAGIALKEKYPAVFEANEEAEKCAQDLNNYVKMHMLFDFRAMTITDYIKLTLSLIEYANNSRSEDKTTPSA